MRFQNVKISLRWPSRMHILALLKITHFWSNLIAWGYQRIFQYYGHCYGSFILEGPAPQTERSNSRGGDGPR